MPPIASLPTSSFLGLMHISDVRKGSDLTDPQASGPQCWLIDAVAPFETPAGGISGSQGLWRSKQLVLPKKLRVVPGVWATSNSRSSSAGVGGSSSSSSSGGGSSSTSQNHTSKPSSEGDGKVAGKRKAQETGSSAKGSSAGRTSGTSGMGSAHQAGSSSGR